MAHLKGAHCHNHEVAALLEPVMLSSRRKKKSNTLYKNNQVRSTLIMKRHVMEYG